MKELSDEEVFGVPVESKALSGVDSLYSIVQMPPGIPVGTLAIGRPGAVNAALLAANGATAGTALYPGQAICLPDGVVVVEGAAADVAAATGLVIGLVMA